MPHEFAHVTWLELSEKQFSLITAGGVIAGRVLYLGKHRGKVKIKAEYNDGLEFSQPMEAVRVVQPPSQHEPQVKQKRRRA